MTGGDDLEENFVIDSDSSDSEESTVQSTTLAKTARAPLESSDDEEERDSASDSIPEPKKVKLNWREVSSRSTGTREDQLETIRASRAAFEKYFPSMESPINGDSLSVQRFLDLSEYCAGESKGTQALFKCLRDREYLVGNRAGAPSGMRTLIVTSSTTRGMFLVKELKEFDKSLSPLPLFFHGGGRKKEQSHTHNSVIKGDKSAVAVCLPSRLRVVLETGIMDFDKIDLILFDLKQNEKKLNVLSQKDTMADSLTIIGRFVLGGRESTLLGLI
jgi:hypothetical protein